MKKFLNKVTITGASDDVLVQDMILFQEKYPFVEWGILLNRSQKGKNKRVPSQDWLNKLFLSQEKTADFLQLSAHLCGIYTNLFLEEVVEKTLDDSKMNELDGLLSYNLFNRVQINTHGEKRDVNMTNLIKNITNRPNVEFVAQIDGVNDYILTLVNSNVQNVSGLYDCSHGQGILPENYQAPLSNIKTGYAGGLNAENLPVQLDKLEPVVSQNSIWIDAENGLRTNDLLDLNKVENFLEICKDRIVL